MNLIALSVPFFFLLMGFEYLVSRWKKRSVYRFSDAVTDLACGIGSQVVGLFLGGVSLTTYTWFYETWSQIQYSPNSWWPWIFGYVGIDFGYYWWHRASHRCNVLWGVHAVHHQSQDYNLAVALRQAWLSGMTSLPFYVPLSFLGISPPIFLSCLALNTVYQFWIHTEFVPKLGFLDRIINTPSAHRVHHAINPIYLDKNYASTFQCWDQMFGTYARESERAVYGTVAPFNSWNSVWANFEHWWAVWKISRKCQSFWAKVQIWFRPPEWNPPELGTKKLVPEVDASTFVKFETQASLGDRIYVAINFVLVSVATTWLLFVAGELQSTEKLMWVLMILASIATWPYWLSNRNSKFGVELARLTVVTVGLMMVL